MVIFLGNVLFLPLVAIRENPEFHDLMRLDKTRWPMLSGVNGASPWAVDASESAAYLVEVALGRYSSGVISDWDLPESFDHDVAASSLSDHPDVWTDGSSVLDRLTGVSASGAVFLPTILSILGMVVGGVMLMVSLLIVTLRAVGVFLRFLGPSRLFRERKCGVSFWLCRPLVLFILGSTIWVLFVMSVDCLTVAVVLCL